VKTPKQASVNVVFRAGDVVKVFYFLTLAKYRKIFTFVGFCTSYNLKRGSFTLQNFHGPEFLVISFMIGAPNIVAIDILTSYNFTSRLSKLYYFRKLRLGVKTDVLSAKRVYRRKDPMDYIYKSRTLVNSEKKRLRNKFRV
jgi:ribosomal protein L19